VTRREKRDKKLKSDNKKKEKDSLRQKQKKSGVQVS